MQTLNKWNQVVAQAPNHSLFQTTFWADRLEDIWRCKRVEIVVDDLQLLLFAVNPKTYRLSRKRKLLESVRRKPWFQWFGTPIQTNPNPDYGKLFKVLNQTSGRVMPSAIQVEAEPFLPENWKREHYSTLIVDLRKSESELWDGLKKTGRKAVKYAQEKGVEVYRLQTWDQMIHYCQTVQTWGLERYGKKIENKDFMSMWSFFHDVDGCVFETFIAKFQGESVASLSVWGFNGYVGELGSFQSDKNVDLRLFGADAVKWEIIRYGVEQGWKEFDLTGMSENPNQKELAIRQFKEKWGAQVRPYLVVSRK